MNIIFYLSIHLVIYPFNSLLLYKFFQLFEVKVTQSINQGETSFKICEKWHCVGKRTYYQNQHLPDNAQIS